MQIFFSTLETKYALYLKYKIIKTVWPDQITANFIFYSKSTHISSDVIQNVKIKTVSLTFIVWRCQNSHVGSMPEQQKLKLTHKIIEKLNNKINWIL